MYSFVSLARTMACPPGHHGIRTTDCTCNIQLIIYTYDAQKLYIKIKKVFRIFRNQKLPSDPILRIFLCMLTQPYPREEEEEDKKFKP